MSVTIEPLCPRCWRERGWLVLAWWLTAATTPIISGPGCSCTRGFAGRPAKQNRRDPIEHDEAAYRTRNWVERLVAKLKQFRRIDPLDQTAACLSSLR